MVAANRDESRAPRHGEKRQLRYLDTTICDLGYSKRNRMKVPRIGLPAVA
jgi:hypothetical protein